MCVCQFHFNKFPRNCHEQIFKHNFIDFLCQILFTYLLRYFKVKFTFITGRSVIIFKFIQIWPNYHFHRNYLFHFRRACRKNKVELIRCHHSNLVTKQLLNLMRKKTLLCCFFLTNIRCVLSSRRKISYHIWWILMVTIHFTPTVSLFEFFLMLTIYCQMHLFTQFQICWKV
jgi:hypothetical protein